MATINQDLSLTKTQLAVFFVTLLLSVDEINPVKIILHVFPSLRPWHIATLSVILFLYVFVSEVKQLLYYMIKIFFHSILSIFFREVDVVGRENIPHRGPVIFTINHANQFMDGVMTLCTCQHKISYLMAEASWKRRVIGDIAWALGVVPVKRAQDGAKSATGKLAMTKWQSGGDAVQVHVRGIGTKFQNELKVGDKVRPSGGAWALKVTEITSNTELTLDGIDLGDDYELPSESRPVTFDILAKVDTKVVFEKVIEKLTAQGAVGIFPEGGSHDRTELLPLKAGIALIAYSALEENGVNVPIVPVGLNYFRAHRWRGRAVVEYGRPILINPTTVKEYEAGGLQRRKVCDALLDEIESGMRSVIVSAPDYETLELIHTARRLYQHKKGPLAAGEKQDLSRRFAEGYRRLMLQTKGNPPDDWLDLQRRIREYRSELKTLALRDFQVPTLTEEHLDEDLQVSQINGDQFLSWLQLPYQIAHFLVLLTLAAIPILFLNLPVGVLAGFYAERRRQKALAKSKVKIRGYDVMPIEKVVFCIIAVPSLWLLYGALLCSLTKLDGPTLTLIFVCFPIFAYMGIIVSDAGMVDLRAIRPYYLRMIPSTRRRLAKLPATRKKLQDDLRAFVRKIGPGLGDLYHGTELNWTKIQDASRQGDDVNMTEVQELKKTK